MKKSKIMRIAALLMVAVLLTTCAISGTFAKYVTESDFAAQTARVAKWGVEINAGTSALFAKTYATDDDTATFTGDNSVVSSTDDLVVAPGTAGSANDLITINGTTEVAVEVAYKGELTLNGFDAYCPLVFTIDGTDYKVGDTDIDDADDLVAAVNEALKEVKAQYAPNASLSAIDLPTIAWAWPFESGNDAADTALGVAADDGEPATVSFQITASVTQID